MTTAVKKSDIDSYSLLRSALAIFKRTPGDLDDEELEIIKQQARNEHDLELRVLTSKEAESVVVNDIEVEKAVQQIRERFEDEESFLFVLQQNELDITSLREALKRQCKVENVLNIVGSKSARISDVEVGIFYHLHPEKFRRPERRNASHILITINDEYTENQRDKALSRITSIARSLQKTPYKFADLAMLHSECPSALQGGELGTFPKGQLYPEIDAVLFTLKKGQISDVLESEVGFHIVKCNNIAHAETISMKKAKPKILKLMQERSQRNCQRAWLASLPPVTPHKQITD
ncbi:nitrogen fixation protein NifM [Methylophaga sp.]|uniref:nitrogen fixation protein NifM n=1 Tax=Methylophaga sp. TaxID=2024840 RepID=UPI002723DF9D|nr:nitrogen fixation protein NifM [Methylophaga sp.]MDO8828072.1 nitrogen fixation protein NifM [Methylophaga sp.]